MYRRSKNEHKLERAFISTNQCINEKKICHMSCKIKNEKIEFRVTKEHSRAPDSTRIEVSQCLAFLVHSLLAKSIIYPKYMINKSLLFRQRKATSG